MNLLWVTCTLASTRSFLIGSIALLGSRGWAIVLGALLAIVALALLVASWTRWGQQKPLTKCVALAFLAHVWLLMYAYGTRVSVPGTGGGVAGGAKTPSFHVTIQSTSPELQDSQSSESETIADRESESGYAEDEMPADEMPADEILVEVKPWESPLPADEPTEIELPSPPQMVIEERTAIEPIEELVVAPESIPMDDAALQQFLATQTPEDATEPLSAPIFSSKNESSLLEEQTQSSNLMFRDSNSVATSVEPKLSDSQSAYQNRFAINRMEIVRAGGGDENTEAAVQLGLQWLSRVQTYDGGWYASQHGGGNPSMIHRAGPDGERRQNAGERANTAMTGLAILSFLGAGHHHLSGEYSNTVSAGLRYLISQQKASGDLSGHDQNGREEVVRYARMYSHGMASLALAEAYAISRDPALLPPVQRAADYSIRAMNPQSGGWRYEFPTNDPGDTSQFGWQAMFLQSAANGGAILLDYPRRRLMNRFLDSVSAGGDGGLATYRPRLGNRTAETPTHAMTAEAMASRLLLGFPTNESAQRESQQMILSRLPGEKEDNFYYWYYATLAMFQMRATSEGEMAWSRWNDAMKRKLLSSQTLNGPDRGAWDPTCIWGPYGGRIYTTSLACLSLEVYYRYLPIYQARQAAQWQPMVTPLR